MGEARRRGTYEKRKIDAMLRDSREQALRAEIARRRPSPKLSRSAAMMLALSVGWGGSDAERALDKHPESGAGEG